MGATQQKAKFFTLASWERVGTAVHNGFLPITAELLDLGEEKRLGFVFLKTEILAEGKTSTTSKFVRKFK